MFHSNVSCLAVSGMFFMMDWLVVWTEVWRPLLLSKSAHTHLYFVSATEQWKHFSLLLNKIHRNKGKQKWAIRGQAQNKRVECILEQCKENHVFEHKRRLRGEPGATTASLDCGPK